MKKEVKIKTEKSFFGLKKKIEVPIYHFDSIEEFTNYAKKEEIKRDSLIAFQNLKVKRKIKEESSSFFSSNIVYRFLLGDKTGSIYTNAPRELLFHCYYDLGTWNQIAHLKEGDTANVILRYFAKEAILINNLFNKTLESKLEPVQEAFF